WSSVGRRSDDRPHNGVQVPLPWSHLHLCTIDVRDYPPDSDCNNGLWAGRAHLTTRALHSPQRLYACRTGMSSRLVAQMKADSSRASAVTITVRRLPFRSSERKRPHSLVCAFHAISRARLGAASTFRCLSRLTRRGCL